MKEFISLWKTHHLGDIASVLGSFAYLMRLYSQGAVFLVSLFWRPYSLSGSTARKK